MMGDNASAMGRVAICARWMTAALCVVSPVLTWATCSVVVPPSPVRAAGFLAGTVGGRGILRANTIETRFTFKCDADTKYTLVLSGASSKGVVTLRGSGGDVETLARIGTINGQPVNQFFANLPVTGYEASASKDQLYEVVIGFVPAPSPGAAARIGGGEFRANVQFLIEY